MIMYQSTFRTTLDDVWPCDVLFLKHLKALKWLFYEQRRFDPFVRLLENLHMAFGEK